MTGHRLQRLMDVEARTVGVRCRACDREREPERLLTVTCTVHEPRCQFRVCRPTLPDRDQFPGGCFRRVVLDRSIHALDRAG